MKRLILILFLVTNSSSYGQEFLTTSGKVKFLSQASLNEFTGESEKLNGLIDLEKNTLDFFVDLNTLKTGIGLRDKHMRDNYLETEKYPFAEFTGRFTSVPELKPGERTAVHVKGAFKVHGIARELDLSGYLTRMGNGGLELDSEFIVLLSDYGIAIPKLVFYELAEKQLVTVKATLNPKK